MNNLNPATAVPTIAPIALTEWNCAMFTDLESSLLTLVADGHTLSFFDDGICEYSSTWLDALTDEAAPILGISAQAFGGVVGSLIKKGVFSSDGEAIFVTAYGESVLSSL